MPSEKPQQIDTISCLQEGQIDLRNDRKQIVATLKVEGVALVVGIPRLKKLLATSSQYRETCLRLFQSHIRVNG